MMFILCHEPQRQQSFNIEYRVPEDYETLFVYVNENILRMFLPEDLAS